jgi:FkbM family methyltransferase
MSAVKAFSQSIARACGLEITKADNTLAQMRRRLLRDLGISLVLDVGANVGQYASELRKSGYRKRIVSFEPIECAFRELDAAFAQDAAHTRLQLALGDLSSEQQMFVSQNLVSSSLLPMTALCVEAHPATACERQERVPVERLDRLLPTLASHSDKVYLKIDTQGYEYQILQGAASCLDDIAAIEIEFSTRPLYAGQALMPEVWSLLTQKGFIPAWVERGPRHPRSNFILQIDALFARSTGETT